MYTALIKLRWRPREWLELSADEKAFTIAALDIYAEELKKAWDK